MKYIDAEKLKAELKRQKHELELSIQSQGDYGQSCHIVAYENILSLITSLQQEQPEVEFEDKFANFLERKDAELGANSWSEEDLRELAEYFYFNNKQPEVDLDKAALHVYESWMGGTMDDVRRDMAELGKVLNARKI